MELTFRLEYKSDVELPSGRWGWLMHDYELINDYWGEKTSGKNRAFPKKNQGKPETVLTFEKDDTSILSDAWQQFYKEMWLFAAFGSDDMSNFPAIQSAFNSAMAYNRVITNHSDWIQGYMTLGMGGNIVKILGEGRPNAKFGESYIVETLNVSEPPPKARDVYYNMPWLWHRATNIVPYNTYNSWQHVEPFPQLEPWNADTPLMFISKRGRANIQKVRVREMNGFATPYPYNP